MTNTCSVCGASFEAHAKTFLVCVKCRPRYNIAYNRLNYKAHKEGLPSPTRAEVAALAKTITPRKRKPKRVVRGGHPCPFCGKPTRRQYCYECTREGYDNIHRTTGRTNGWNTRRGDAPKVKVAGGWRGQPCAGGATPRAERQTWGR